MNKAGPIALGILAVLAGWRLSARFAATPNRACAIAIQMDGDSHCEDIGRGLGAASVDVAIWHTSGGVKWCVSGLDVRGPFQCSSIVLSAIEQAQIRSQTGQATNIPNAHTASAAAAAGASGVPGDAGVDAYRTVVRHYDAQPASPQGLERLTGAAAGR